VVVFVTRHVLAEAAVTGVSNPDAGAITIDVTKKDMT